MRDEDVRMPELGPRSAAFHNLQAVPQQVGLMGPTKPKAILIISAHWETQSEVHITSRDAYDSLLFDYSGFPAYTYDFTYPAPGSSALAARIQELLTGAAVPCMLDATRLWDHGVFIPLMVMYPDASIPVVQISLLSSLDPAAHLAIGRALAPLRDEGVLILGSGFITHNFSRTGDTAPFVAAMETALTGTAEQREKALLEWKALPAARHAHAREEHLMPLHVVVGAAGDDAATVLASLSTWAGGLTSAHYAFFSRISTFSSQ